MDTYWCINWSPCFTGDFRVVKLFCKILLWWTHIIVHLSRHTECTTQRVNLVNFVCKLGTLVTANQTTFWESIANSPLGECLTFKCNDLEKLIRLKFLKSYTSVLSITSIINQFRREDVDFVEVFFPTAFGVCFLLVFYFLIYIASPRTEWTWFPGGFFQCLPSPGHILLAHSC